MSKPSAEKARLALALIATALPTDTVFVNNKAEPPKYPGVLDNLILKNPAINNRPIRHAYMGKIVRVNANPDEVSAIVNDLRERRRLNNLKKLAKGAI